MSLKKPVKVGFFPGCSLATSATENEESLRIFCSEIGYELETISDWNCCGSTSAHSINSRASFWLAARNLALAPQDKPLVVACPNCYKRLRKTQVQILDNPASREEFEKTWGKFPEQLQLVPFLDFLASRELGTYREKAYQSLNNLKFVPYYGCMLAMPPKIVNEASHMGVMENTLGRLGARPISWGHWSRCCGTFLSIAKPELVKPIINDIMDAAYRAGAECLVTACAMCHLNLEVRCTTPKKLPIFHFSELLALTAGVSGAKPWFNRHIIDPGPLLKSRKLI